MSTGPSSFSEEEIVFYDDACRFCHASAAFLARLDRRNRFRFAPLYSLIACYRYQCPGSDASLPNRKQLD